MNNKELLAELEQLAKEANTKWQKKHLAEMLKQFKQSPDLAGVYLEKHPQLHSTKYTNKDNQIG